MIKNLTSCFATGLLAATLATPFIATSVMAERPDDWPLATPESVGLSTVALDTAAGQVKDVPLRYCMSVVKNGELIYDNNFRGEANDRYFTFSVTKTLGALLIGIAEYQGYLSINDKVSDWLDSYPSSINPDATIRDVMGQVAHSDPLGSDFKYNSGARVNTLGEILSVATGMTSDNYADVALFNPLGMQYSSWASDFSGNIAIGGGVTSTCRDLARIGQLMMDGGVWRGERLLSADYIHDMTQPSYPDANSNYGYLTWLNKSEGEWHRILVSGDDIMVKNAPRNAYFATGFFGQLIINIPDENVVVTTLGTSLQLETLNTLQDVWDAIEPAIMQSPLSGPEIINDMPR